MLEQLIIELAKSTKQVEDIQSDKTYLIINKDDEGLDVEIKFSRERYEIEEKPNGGKSHANLQQTNPKQNSTNNKIQRKNTHN
ncbi:hypothetical protein P4T34_16965 [Bacillus mobilis]|uniref:hypothetical protein n=1 Tax=Bacillus mobilis TaxID=2026190 RepID=UPI002E246230|nr:hypothetical protein [Bacillus mobilis]